MPEQSVEVGRPPSRERCSEDLRDMNARVLLVDDDRELCRMLTEYLAQEGFSVMSVHEGARALTVLDEETFQMVILDVMLPGLSGLEVLRELRPQWDLPVLMLTARGDDVDRVVGLEMGADDYLPKPFNVRELVARLRAILRRADKSQSRTGRVEVGRLTLDRRTHTVTFSDAALTLTGAEFRILETLMLQVGSVVSRERLMQEAVGRRRLPWDRSIDTHVGNLRRKLAAVGAGPLILSVRGSGYQLLG